jgi:ATP-dependent DNA ligase
VYELKWDGYRCAAVHALDGSVRLWSRQGKALTSGFPDVAAALADQVLPGTVLDGELVIWNGSALDFDLLHRRLVSGERRAQVEAAAHPATYMAFDVLAADGHDVRRRPWSERREVLDLFAADWDPPLQASPVTEDPVLAREWAEQFAPAGLEGLVAKQAAGRYVPGRRDWVKVKTRESTEVIVGAVTGALDAIDTVVVGRYGPDGLRMLGRSLPVAPAQRAALRQALTRAGPEHPWPEEVAANRFGSGRARVPLTRVEPTVVVEIETDLARAHGSYRHAVRLVRLRPDLDPDDVAADV